MHRFTKLTDEELAAYLAKIRRIARMADEDAVAEVDELVYNLAQRGVASVQPTSEPQELDLDDTRGELTAFEYELKVLRSTAKRDDISLYSIQSFESSLAALDGPSDSGGDSEMAKRISRLQDSAKTALRDAWVAYGKVKLREFDEQIARLTTEAPDNVRPWHVTQLQHRVERLGGDWGSSALEVLTAELEQRKEAGRIALAEFSRRAASAAIETLQHEVINSAQTTRSILRRLDEAVAALAPYAPLSDEQATTLHAARERCVRYRAGKKLAAAEVAQLAGQENKSKKLMREADALLQQDWKAVFPDEDVPPLE